MSDYLGLTSVIALLLLWPQSTNGADPAESVDRETSEIARLEAQLFDPVLAPREVEGLLKRLVDDGQRTAATQQLVREGQSRQARIIDFAHDCDNLEARQACADIIEALDSAYRTTDLGRQLGAHYRRRGMAGVPPAWQRFRENPLDIRSVAILMAAEPEAVYRWLGEHGDRYDPLRYLLLRVRELSPDAFVAKHFMEHTEPGADLVQRDVFPIGGRVHRVVGHTAIGVLGVSENRTLAVPRIPKLTGLSYSRRITYLATTKFDSDHRAASMRWDAYSYSIYANRPSPTSDVRKNLPDNISLRSFNATVSSRAPHSICQLPVVHVTRNTTPQWHSHDRTMAASWLKPLIPLTLHGRLRFFPVGPAPKITFPFAAIPLVAPLAEYQYRGPDDPKSPTVICLPPKISSDASDGVRFAAELLSDRLAQEIDGHRLARVVDRLQLDAVLDERKRLTGALPPLISYDAMIGIDVDTERLAPMVTVRVLEISTGNELGAATTEWPIDESQIAPLVRMCRVALPKSVIPKGEKLRVRALADPEFGGNPRLRRFADRIREVFGQALASTKKIQIVHHLEAESSRDESLLLLLGLTRLPDGRRFAPQADVTVELRISEHKAVGKSFEDTELEIGVRLRKGDRDTGDWTISRGPVKQFDQVLEVAWKKLAASLSGAGPDTVKLLNDGMRRRREQSNAELRAAFTRGPASSYKRDEERMGYMLSHLEAALKLDPLNEDAHYKYVEALKCVHCRDSRDRLDEHRDARAARVVTEALRYHQRFGQQVDGDRLVNVNTDVAIALMFSSLAPLRKGDDIGLDHQLMRTIEAIKQIVELTVETKPGTKYSYLDRLLPVAYHGMRLQGVSLARCQQWVDRILESSQRQASSASQSNKSNLNKWEYADLKKSLLSRQLRLRLSAAELALADRQVDRAGKLIGDLQLRLQQGGIDKTGLEDAMRNVVVAMDDQKTLTEFDTWRERYRETPRFLTIEWPELRIFGEQPAPSVPRTVMDSRRFGAVSGLLSVDDRMFVVTRRGNAISWGDFYGRGTGSVSQSIGFVRLDAEGHPVGDPAKPQNRKPGDRYLSAIQLLPQQPKGPILHVSQARKMSPGIAIGTVRSGILLLNAADQSWRTFTTDDGLPSQQVNSLLPLNADTLYCASRDEKTSAVTHFTLNVRSGMVRLYHRNIDGDGRTTEVHLWHLWRNDKSVMARGLSGVLGNLLTDSPSFELESNRLPYGWTSPSGVRLPITNAFEIGGRMFFNTSKALHESDAAGKTLRSWTRRCSFGDFGPPSLDLGFHNSMTVPADSLAIGGAIAAGRHIVCIGSRVSVYDPVADTWYGPVRISRSSHAIGSRAGIWLGKSDSLVFISTTDIIAAARRADRVLTSAEYVRRKADIVAAEPPLVRGKLYFAMRQFSAARTAFAEVLTQEPDNAEALLLMGSLSRQIDKHDAAAAIAYYRRLADHKDASAQLTGLYLWLLAAAHDRQWQVVIDVGDKLKGRYPGLDPEALRRIEAAMVSARKSLKTQ